MDIQIKRIYEPVSKEDGIRVLVDRVWPRGIRKENANLQEWMKEIAPSTELRKWYNHQEALFKEFSIKYRKELDRNLEFVEKLKTYATEKRLTLVYGAKDEIHNQAVVLKTYLEGK
ncbi:MAG: DUF488 domain-containing protein [Bacteroidetes bacterium]|nr:DUF488 domain-containing protein [Bacteroidota bacterium]